MAALSMVTIAAFINSPGLGSPVITALASLDVGTAFTAGILIAFMAILLDRATTAAGERTRLMRTVRQIRRRRIGLAVGLIVVGVAIYYSHIFLALAQFPTRPELGQPVSAGAQGVADFVSDHGSAITGPISRGFTIGLLNPFQALVANSPWWLIGAALILISWLVAGLRSVITTTVCVAVILGVGIWHEAMITLATALVATVWCRPGAGVRRADGQQQAGGPDHPTGTGRGPDHSRLRLSGAGRPCSPPPGSQRSWRR